MKITLRVQNHGLYGRADVLSPGACDGCGGAASLRVRGDRSCGVQRMPRVEHLALRVEDTAVRVVYSVLRTGAGQLRGHDAVLRVGASMLRVRTAMLRVRAAMLRIGAAMLRAGAAILRVSAAMLRRVHASLAIRNVDLSGRNGALMTLRPIFSGETGQCETSTAARASCGAVCRLVHARCAFTTAHDGCRDRRAVRTGGGVNGGRRARDWEARPGQPELKGPTGFLGANGGAFNFFDEGPI